MMDRRDEGPLGSDELAGDRKRSDADPLAGVNSDGDARPASESGPQDHDDGETRERPNPIAGTMLPPD